MPLEQPMDNVWRRDWEEAVKRTPIGYILLTVQPGCERSVAENMRTIEDILEVYNVHGDYDIIAKFKCEEVLHGASVIIRKIRRIDGVLRSETLIVSSP